MAPAACQATLARSALTGGRLPFREDDRRIAVRRVDAKGRDVHDVEVLHQIALVRWVINRVDHVVRRGGSRKCDRARAGGLL